MGHDPVGRIREPRPRENYLPGTNACMLKKNVVLDVRTKKAFVAKGTKLSVAAMDPDGKKVVFLTVESKKRKLK